METSEYAFRAKSI